MSNWTILHQNGDVFYTYKTFSRFLLGFNTLYLSQKFNGYIIDHKRVSDPARLVEMQESEIPKAQLKDLLIKHSSGLIIPVRPDTMDVLESVHRLNLQRIWGDI